MWYVYILECENGQLYTGMTDNVSRRWQEHLEGRGGRFTRLNKVHRLLHTEEHATAQEAKIREEQLKRWSRAKKMALIEGNLISLRKF